MSIRQPPRDRAEPSADPLPFPVRQARRSAAARPLLPESMDDMLSAFDDMSRHINDLARELKCLGYFDDPNGDLPRAA